MFFSNLDKCRLAKGLFRHYKNYFFGNIKKISRRKFGKNNMQFQTWQIFRRHFITIKKNIIHIFLTNVNIFYTQLSTK